MLIRADAREIPLIDSCIHVAVTSPPYWGLRDYSTGTWEGGEPDCEHSGGGRGGSGGPGKQTRGAMNDSSPARGGRNTCVKCGATRRDAQIGLEATPDEFVANMLRVFREVHRVLRPDGSLWMNLGDSYAADRGGTHMPAETLAGGVSGRSDDPAAHRGRAGRVPRRDCKRYGLKHKDLVAIPWRVALAMQGFAVVPIDELAGLCRAIDCLDVPALQAFRAGFRLWEELSGMGWYWLRSDVVWSKPNPMPESVTDRPTKAHEYIFMLTKSDRYYYDPIAVAEAASTLPVTAARRGRVNNGAVGTIGLYGTEHGQSGNGGRRMRTPTGWDTGNGNKGHKKTENRHGRFASEVSDQEYPETRNRRSVWNINTQGFDMEACLGCRRTYNAGDYDDLPFASESAMNGGDRESPYPGDREWRRNGSPPPEPKSRARVCRCGRSDAWLSHFATFPEDIPRLAIMAGSSARGCCSACGTPLRRASDGVEWMPGCSCVGAGVVPCRVLDPFAGSGTTVRVATDLGRLGIGLDYSWDYLQLFARHRIITTMGLPL